MDAGRDLRETALSRRFNGVDSAARLSLLGSVSFPAVKARRMRATG
jgi:hypothetical protein